MHIVRNFLFQECIGGNVSCHGVFFHICYEPLNPLGVELAIFIAMKNMIKKPTFRENIVAHMIQEDRNSHKHPDRSFSLQDYSLDDLQSSARHIFHSVGTSSTFLLTVRPNTNPVYGYSRGFRP